MTDPPVTKSRVNTAGQTLRKWATGTQMIREDQVVVARKVLVTYRESHKISLRTVTMSVRSAVTSGNCVQMRVSQRLKRVPTIIDKLIRQPTMQLATMQDIAGCRAVVRDLDELRRVAARLSPKADRVNDYVETPGNSGYRGVHMIRTYRGHPVEIQPRTAVMHDWAVFVEDLGRRHAWDLKSSHGPDDVLAWLESASRMMALEEQGEPIPSDLELLHLAQRDTALAFLRKGAS